MTSLARLTAIALIVVSCQGITPTPTPSASQVVVPATTAPPTPSPSARVPVGGTLRVALSAPIGALDPQVNGANPLVVDQIFEGLVARGTSGVVPALATKWLVAADGKTWTFTLREGVTFHDGAALDATTAAKALTRLNDPIIEKADAIDARTLVLTTYTPSGTFLSALATVPYLIVSPVSRTSGTGPFRAPPGAEGVRPLVLDRNERYWRADASGQKLPYLDKLSFTSITDAGTRLASIRSGNVDYVQDLALADIGAIRTDPSLQVVARPETSLLYLGLNLSLPPLDDLRLRQAIAMSANGRTLVDRLYGGLGTAASQMPPPGMLGYDDSVTEFAKNDPAAAKKLLGDAGRANQELDLWYVLDGPASQPDMRRAAEALGGDLAAAGIVVTTKTIDPITFAVGVRENRYPMWLGIATAASFDPDDLLGAAFIPPVVNGQDQPTEAGGWLNKEVAGLLRKARSEPDQSKRAEIYKQVSKVVQREIPRVPLVWSAAPAAATRKVVNAQGSLFADVGLGK